MFATYTAGEWLRCFFQFDRDRSGSIDRAEFRTALMSFGYQLSEQVQQLIVNKYDRTGRS